MRGEHPGLSPEVLTECLDVWLAERLSPVSIGRLRPLQDRTAVHELAEDLAAYLWRILEPRQLGFKPPFGGPRENPRCDSTPLCLLKRGHPGACIS